MDTEFDFEAVKRMESAKKIRPAAVLSEDRSPGKEAAVIQGSAAEPYRVTLLGCTCPDYIRTRKPCKHMYRLFLDCGKLNLPVLKKKKDRTFSPNAEIQRYKKLYIDGEIDGDTYTKICSILAKAK